MDEVGALERVAALSTRSIKRESKRAALDLIVATIDLTTLEGKDTAGKVAQMSAKAIRPDPLDSSVPSVAAVCIYPNMVKYAVQATEGTDVRVVSVATYFPSGLADIDLKAGAKDDVAMDDSLAAAFKQFIVDEKFTKAEAQKIIGFHNKGMGDRREANATLTKDATDKAAAEHLTATRACNEALAAHEDFGSQEELDKQTD